MKCAKKAIQAHDDCFNATEGDAHVRIMRFRHMIIVDASTDRTECRAEITLSQLAYLLRNADKLTKETP
jgi:hypothetical protein